MTPQSAYCSTHSKALAAHCPSAATRWSLHLLRVMRVQVKIDAEARTAHRQPTNHQLCHGSAQYQLRGMLHGRIIYRYYVRVKYVPSNYEWPQIKRKDQQGLLSLRLTNSICDASLVTSDCLWCACLALLLIRWLSPTHDPQLARHACNFFFYRTA